MYITQKYVQESMIVKGKGTHQVIFLKTTVWLFFIPVFVLKKIVKDSL